MNKWHFERLRQAAAALALLILSCSPGNLFSGEVCEEPCLSPPAPSCTDGLRVYYESNGVCDNGSCRYSPREVACEHGCLEGSAQCRSSSDESCASLACPEPPAPSCRGDELVSWAPTCVDDGGSPECGPPRERSTLCEHGCDEQTVQCRGPPEPIVRIDNPYLDVDWGSWQQYKANFHTHTTESDGQLSPAQVIDQYHGASYAILAITDHNKNTWPWGRWDRDAAALGMVGVSGNEFSAGHHLGGLLSTRTGSVSDDERVVLDTLVADGGLAILYHPGRYSKTVSWYTDLYTAYEQLVGLEVYNQGDRYPNDRDTWDTILAVMMPDRPVWGYANDDMHGTGQLFGNYSLMLLPSLSESELRAAMVHGRSYFSYEPGRSGQALAPRIQSIVVDEIAGTIRLEASGHTAIGWIAGGVEIAQGETLDVAAHLAAGEITTYVRAQLVGELGRTYTQPFGVRPLSSD